MVIHRLDNGKLISDVVFDVAKDKARAKTSTRCSVELMTIVTLLENSALA